MLREDKNTEHRRPVERRKEGRKTPERKAQPSSVQLSPAQQTYHTVLTAHVCSQDSLVEIQN
jgi:hypothetical protein